MKYIEEYEWFKVDGDVIVVGIIEYVSEQLGDIVFVELFEENIEVVKDDEVVVIEFVKVVFDIFVLLDGEIVEVNSVLVDNLLLVNDDLLNDGWFFKMKIEDMFVLDDLMDEVVYKVFIG